MADPIPLHVEKPPATDPVVAAKLREALEWVIEQGVVGGMVSGETPEGTTTFRAYPEMAGFARGHATNVFEDMEALFRADEE